MTTKELHKAVIIKATQEAKAVYANVQKQSGKQAPTIRDYYHYRVSCYPKMRKLIAELRKLPTDAEVLQAVEKIHAYKRKCYGEWPLIKGLVKDSE